MVNIDKYIHLKYTDCNCLELVVRLYKEEYDLDLSSLLEDTFSIPKCLHKVKVPSEGAIMVLYRPDYPKHVGIYTGHKILHTLQPCGMRHDSLHDLATRQWTVKSIYAAKNP